MCERELETEQNYNILTPTLLTITAFFSCSPGLLNRDTFFPSGLLNRGPSLSGCWFSLSHLISDSSDPQLINRVLAGCWLSLQHLVSNWLNFLCTELYNSSKSTFFLWASQIALIQPIHGQGYTPLFLDWMHLLFTQVHFLFWQPGWVVGQYTTNERIL